VSQYRKTTTALTVVVVAGVIAAAYFMGRSDERAGRPFSLANPAQAATSPSSTSPVGVVDPRDVYYPGSESLAPDEMRIIACGTGMPNARPKQAAACWLVELGNGDKFIFDIGSGSADRISAMKIPYDYLDKVFIGHLHSDHFGDMGDLWIGGVIGNRIKPLRVWGPSGDKPEFGTAYALDHMQKMFAWDSGSRLGNVDIRGQVLEVHEFDYKAVNKVIFEENGVTVRSIPAIHALDGPVSFILEWNGLKFAFSSDTYPNKWWMEHAKGADLAVHECFAPPEILVEKQRWTPEAALNVGTQVHTSPAQFGKVMSLIKPRMAVGYHFFNDFDTLPAVLAQARQTYDGPLELATDYMVFNVTKKEIRTRMAVIDEDIWPQPAVGKKLPPDASKRIGFSDYITGGRVVFTEVIQNIYDEINKKYGSKAKPPL
jgi:ribonuclease Z